MRMINICAAYKRCGVKLRSHLFNFQALAAHSLDSRTLTKLNILGTQLVTKKNTVFLQDMLTSWGLKCI